MNPPLDVTQHISHKPSNIPHEPSPGNDFSMWIIHSVPFQAELVSCDAAITWKKAWQLTSNNRSDYLKESMTTDIKQQVRLPERKHDNWHQTTGPITWKKAWQLTSQNRPDYLKESMTTDITQQAWLPERKHDGWHHRTGLTTNITEQAWLPERKQVCCNYVGKMMKKAFLSTFCVLILFFKNTSRHFCLDSIWGQQHNNMLNLHTAGNTALSCAYFHFQRQGQG